MKLSLLGAGIAAVAAALLATAMPAQATTAFFDFENQAIGTETPFTMTSSGISATFAGPSSVDPGAFGISSNFASPTGFTYRLMSGDFLTIGSAFGASGSPLTITFSQAITSFSLDFALDDPANLTTLAFTTNGSGAGTESGALTSGFRYPEGSLSFSGSAFTSITFASDAIDFQIDNLQVNTAATSVPEPASLLLLGACVPASALARRRERRIGRTGRYAGTSNA